MMLARVVANVVSTEKHPHYKGQKILVVQPVDPEGKPKGRSLLAVDGVQAGIGDLVLVVDEGGSARAVIGDESAVTVRTAICGIVDRVDIGGQASDERDGQRAQRGHRRDHGAVTQKEMLKTLPADARLPGGGRGLPVPRRWTTPTSPWPCAARW